MGGRSSRVQHVYVQPTIEQKQKNANAKMAALQQAGNEQLLRLEDCEKRLHAEMTMERDSTMALMLGVEKNTQLSIQEIALKAQEREAQFDDMIAELRAKKAKLVSRNIKSIEQLQAHEKTLELKKTNLTQQKELLDQQAEDIRGRIDKLTKRQAHDDAVLKQILTDWLNIEGTTDSSVAGVVELMCQLNKLPHVLDKASNTGMKEGLDAICQWLTDGIARAKDHLKSWGMHMKPPQTLEWARDNNLNERVVQAISDNGVSLADLLEFQSEDFVDVFGNLPAWSLRKLKVVLDQARHNEGVLMPRLAGELEVLRLGVAPVCVWHDQVEGQAANAALLSGAEQRKALTD